MIIFYDDILLKCGLCTVPEVHRNFKLNNRCLKFECSEIVFIDCSFSLILLILTLLICLNMQMRVSSEK